MSEAVHTGSIAKQQRDVGEISGGACAVQQIGISGERRGVDVKRQQVVQLLRVSVGDGGRQLTTQFAV